MLRRVNDASLRQLLLLAALASGTLIILVVTALAWPLVRRLVMLACASILFAYLTVPLVEIVHKRITIGRQRRRLPRSVAILVIFALIASTAFVAWRLATPLFERQMLNLSSEAHRTVHMTLARVRNLDRVSLGLGMPAPVGDRLAIVVLGLADQIEGQADGVLREANDHVPFLPWLWLSPVIAFFLIKDWKPFRHSAVRVLPEGHLRWRGEEFLRHVNSVLAGYTRAQLLSCLIIGGICTAGFALLGVPYPLALGAMAGVLEFLPVVGPLATAVVAAGLVSGTRLVLLLVFLIVLRLLQDYVIYPKLTGKRMHLHPVAIVGAVFVGAKYGGLVGVFCAVPLVGILAVMVRHYREYRDIQRLIDEHELEALQVEATGALEGQPAESDAPAADDGRTVEPLRDVQETDTLGAT
jgi:predicted PurR-regulated permease PerM